MKNDWKRLTEEFVEKEDMATLQRILRLLINPNNLSEELKKTYTDFMKHNERNAIIKVLEDITTKYSTFIFPTMLGRDSAPNFWLKGEKNAPSVEEAWKATYLLLSSVPVHNILLNLDNVSKGGRSAWRQLLSEDPTQFYSRIKEELNIRSSNWGTFYTVLLAISYFVYRTRTNISRSELGLQEYLDELKHEYGFSDHTTLVTFQMGRGKKEVHYFSKLTSIIERWFGEYIVGDEENPSLLRFLDSLTSISSSVKSDLISDLREKLIFYILKHNEINGELLAKLVILKTQDVLKAKKRFGVIDAKRFFSKLNNSRKSRA